MSNSFVFGWGGWNYHCPETWVELSDEVFATRYVQREEDKEFLRSIGVAPIEETHASQGNQ